MIEYIKRNNSKWTCFFDMSSGGGEKLPWGIIYIEAPEHEAIEIFKNRFDYDPNNVTCDCCGLDFSITEHETLSEASYLYRGKQSVEEYAQDPRILIMQDPRELIVGD